MRHFRSIVAGILVAGLLAACGSGDKAQFRYVVSFGDSFSDAGTYRVGTIAALGGGQFTVNGPTAKVWTQYLAELVKAPAQCAARTGLLPNNGVTGEPVMDFANCFNYAQGSARVTSSGTGPNGVGLQAFGDNNLGLLAESIKDQMTRHLSKIGGAYTAVDLITVNAGGNDLFMQLNAVGAAAGGGPAAAGAAQIAGWPDDVVATVSSGGAQATQAAAAAAVAGMGQAGAELAGYVKSLLLAKGAQFVIVRNLADANASPYGLALDGATQGLIAAAITAFNGQLKAGLNGSNGVLLFDDYAASQAIAANPATYGFTNTTTPSCGTNAFGGPNGPSIVCNATNLIAGDTSHFVFADDVHPTPYAHSVAANTAFQLMVSAEWQ